MANDGKDCLSQRLALRLAAERVPNVSLTSYAGGEISASETLTREPL